LALLASKAGRHFRGRSAAEEETPSHLVMVGRALRSHRTPIRVAAPSRGIPTESGPTGILPVTDLMNFYDKNTLISEYCKYIFNHSADLNRMMVWM